MKIIEVIKINPFDCTVKAVKIRAENLADYYREIECQTFDCVGLSNGDGIYCDDEALLLEEQPPAFQLQGKIIHGIGLVVGTDREGNSTKPRHTLAEIQSQVAFLGRLPYQEPVIHFIPL
jgi:hypothetical protein